MVQCSITYNGLAMFSSGIEAQNYQNEKQLNRVINLAYSNKTAIKYSCCYALLILRNYDVRKLNSRAN